MYLRKLITVCVPKVGMQMCMLTEGIHKINENYFIPHIMCGSRIFFFCGGGKGGPTVIWLFKFSKGVSEAYF